jgi:hypothetical protein
VRGATRQRAVRDFPSQTVDLSDTHALEGLMAAFARDESVEWLPKSDMVEEEAKDGDVGHTWPSKTFINRGKFLTNQLARAATMSFIYSVERGNGGGVHSVPTKEKGAHSHA